MRLITLCLVTLAFATPALAQQESTAPSKVRTQVVDMSDEVDVLEGVRLSHREEAFVVRTPARFKSLIQIREDFKDKIAQSIDEL